MKNLQQTLKELADNGYKDFHASLIPTINKDSIIGVRVPLLRKLAKEISGTEIEDKFLAQLPHKYFDENQLHAILVSNIKDYQKCLVNLEEFLPYIDNWSTCDLINPKILTTDSDNLFIKIYQWLKSDHVYTVRLAIKLLMSFYLDKNFSVKHLELVAKVKLDDYYVKMVISWYFATALVKQYDKTIIYLEEYRLSPWIHRKTIQKACESYRISTEQKIYLKTLR